MKYGIKLTTELLNDVDKEMVSKILGKYLNRFLDEIGRDKDILVTFETDEVKEGKNE